MRLIYLDYLCFVEFQHILGLGIGSVIGTAINPVDPYRVCIGRFTPDELATATGKKGPLHER